MNPSCQWTHYTQIPRAYRKPDHRIPNGSAGYATMQNLLKLGFTFNQDTPNYTDTTEQTFIKKEEL